MVVPQACAHGHAPHPVLSGSGRFVLRVPFYFPRSHDGEGEGSPVLPEDNTGGKTPQDTVAVMAGGLWVVVLVLSVFPVFNAGVSVSARNLLSKMWGLNLKLSCFLGLNAEPHGHPMASIARLLDFRS